MCKFTLLWLLPIGLAVILGSITFFAARCDRENKARSDAATRRWNDKGFVAGAVVRLKSGGPSMTIESVYSRVCDDKVHSFVGCVFARAGKKCGCTASYSVESVELVKPRAKQGRGRV